MSKRGTKTGARGPGPADRGVPGACAAVARPPAELGGSLSFLLAIGHKRAQDAVQRALLGGQITFPQYLLMVAVHAGRGEVAQADITRMTGIDRSTVAEMVRRLAGRGFVVQGGARRDRRKNAVSLTADGVRALDAARAHIAAADAEVAGVLGERRTAGFVKGLQRLGLAD